MKLTANLEIVDMGDEIIAVPVGAGANIIHGVLKLNKSGAELLDLLKQDTSEEEIVETLSQKYDNDRTILEHYVHDAIESLSKADLLA